MRNRIAAALERLARRIRKDPGGFKTAMTGNRLERQSAGYSVGSTYVSISGDQMRAIRDGLVRLERERR